MNHHSNLFPKLLMMTSLLQLDLSLPRISCCIKWADKECTGCLRRSCCNTCDDDAFGVGMCLHNPRNDTCRVRNFDSSRRGLESQHNTSNSSYHKVTANKILPTVILFLLPTRDRCYVGFGTPDSIPDRSRLRLATRKRQQQRYRP
jgi:hypothetical protein